MATRTGTTPSFFQHLPRGRWALVVAAFLLGLLLFALVWLAGRRHDSASVPGPVQPVAAPVEFDPLPRPMPAGEASAPPAPAGGEAPRLVEETPPPPPQPAPDESAPLPPSIEDVPPPVAAAAAMQAPSPLADQSPSPRYPVAAMRRGESGTVVVQVQVDALGQPVSVQVGGRSGSRELDRAALEAVQKWRFAPARDAEGNPVPGELSVPIDFKLE